MDAKLISREMHSWRMATSVFWSIVFQFLFLLAYIFFNQINIFHPFSSVANWFKIITSLSIWLYAMPFTIIIFAQGIVCSKCYISGPICYSTRLAKFKSIFSFTHLTMCGLHIFIGATIVFIYTSFSEEGLNSFTTVCKRELDDTIVYHCFSEKRFFLVLGGIWIGMYYFLHDHLYNSRTITFPPIQQLKFIQVKSRFVPSFKQAIWDSVLPSALFLAIYYLKGGLLRSWFCNILSTNLYSEPMDTIFGLLNIPVMLHLWLFSSIFIMTLRQMEMLFNIHLTEYCKFPITTGHLNTNGCICLKEALSMSDVPIIQHLAFLDLFILSEKDRQRRAEIFSLSQPGGHPHTWTGIVGEVLKVILAYTKELEAVYTEPEPPPVKLSNSMNLHSKVMLSASYTSNKNMRNLSETMEYNLNNEAPRSNIQQQIDQINDIFVDWFDNKKKDFLNKPLMLYLVGERPEKKLCYLLYQSEPIIWAAQSLSLLVCASLIEDSYGVVQNNLSNIIMALLDLKRALDKIPKQLIGNKKSQGSESFEMQQRLSLKSAVKRSIYKIAITFRDYINDIGLTPEAQQQLFGCVACREV